MNYKEEVIKLARKNESNNFTKGGPFGALVVDPNGKIIGKGYNKVITNHDSTAHAEVCAIRNAEKKLHSHDLEGCTLYTSSYPCPMCMAAIVWSNIKNVYYVNDLSKAAEIGFRDEELYKEFETGNFSIRLEKVECKEGDDLFERYKQNNKTINY